MRARIEALNPLDKIKSSTAYLANIIALKMVALLLSLTGNARLNDDNNVVKQTTYDIGCSVTSYHS